MFKLSQFEGRTYLITGITSGIGKGVTEVLLSAGAKVVGIGRDASKIDSLLQDDNLIFIKLDVANDIHLLESVLLDKVNVLGKFNGFIHCAGKEETLPLSLYNLEKVSEIFTLNVFSGIEILRIFSKKKISEDNSSIIFMSSVMGELGQAGKVGYCSTKAAILGIVRSAALELSKRKFRVNAISPGVVKTPMTENLFNHLQEENIKQIENMHPLGFGEVKDVVPCIIFLLSDDSRWMTGQNLIIDGGYSIQ